MSEEEKIGGAGGAGYGRGETLGARRGAAFGVRRRGLAVHYGKSEAGGAQVVGEIEKLGGEALRFRGS